MRVCDLLVCLFDGYRRCIYPEGVEAESTSDIDYITALIKHKLVLEWYQGQKSNTWPQPGTSALPFVGKCTSPPSTTALRAG